MPRPAVEFQGVSKVYRTGLARRHRVCALCDVTLSVPRGSVFGILGPNRAGKTTLVKALLSICRPTSGTIVRLGRPAQDRSTLARVGYLHENHAFPRYLTATALLRYYGGLSLVSRRELDERVPQLLEQVGLADRPGEPIASFSKGMLQRLALAQALVNDPELLVLDEPTEGMDLAARRLLHDVIRQRKTEGKTAVLVSHSMADVERACDGAAVLRGGRVLFAGPLAELVGDDENGVSADALQQALEPMYAGALA
jgi:ABC-2 type transport system ATP-binding protein